MLSHCEIARQNLVDPLGLVGICSLRRERMPSSILCKHIDRIAGKLTQRSVVAGLTCERSGFSLPKRKEGLTARTRIPPITQKAADR